MPELIPVEPGTPEWLAARRQGVTATDIVSILGIGYKSAYWLYWNKLGQVPGEPDSDRFRLGRYLEPYIAEQMINPIFAVTPDLTISAGLYRHSDRAWQLATLDRLAVRGSNILGVIELKTWADADRHSWADGPPAAVRAQVLWQMDVMDVSTGHVGVVFLPSGEFRSYVIEHDPSAPLGYDVTHTDPICDLCGDILMMRARGAEFYARLQGELPPPDIDASAASLAAVKAPFRRRPQGTRRPRWTVMPELIPAEPRTPEPTWTTFDGQHSTHMEMRSTMHYAVCSCGWVGPGCFKKRVAIQDAMDHLAAVTHA